jgi:antitoxin VapB
VKLFRMGEGQAVCIPRDFELPGREAIMSKQGERLILEPVLRPSLLAVLATLSPIAEELPPIEELPYEKP